MLSVSACISRQADVPSPETVEASVSLPPADAQVSAAVVAEPAPPQSEQVVIPAPEVQPEFDQGHVVWIQERLQALGYYSGPADGSAGKATRQAIKTYQTDQGLQTDGRPTAELREFMWRNGG